MANIVHKSFHDRDFQSLQLMIDGHKKQTIGMMLPGSYDFRAIFGRERITITSGLAEINGQIFQVGEIIVVEANCNVRIVAKEPCSYICVFE